jgi:hypothetical protein
MAALIRLALEAAVRMGAANSIGDCARRLVVLSFGAIAVGVLMIASVGCAAASLWIFCMPRLGPVGAPLVVAGILLAMSLALLLMLPWLSMRRSGIRPPSSTAPASVLADAMCLLKDDKTAALIAALVAGLAAGSSKG